MTVQVHAATLPAAISDSCLRDADRSDPVPVTHTVKRGSLQWLPAAMGSHLLWSLCPTTWLRPNRLSSASPGHLLPAALHSQGLPREQPASSQPPSPFPPQKPSC